jgi:hypothetical protein
MHRSERSLRPRKYGRDVGLRNLLTFTLKKDDVGPGKFSKEASSGFGRTEEMEARSADYLDYARRGDQIHSPHLRPPCPRGDKCSFSSLA